MPLVTRHQAGAGAQQRGLAGAVRALQQDDLPGHHVEVDAGQGRKAAEQGDRAAEVDDGLHGDRPTLPAPPRTGQGDPTAHGRRHLTKMRPGGRPNPDTEAGGPGRDGGEI